MSPGPGVAWPIADGDPSNGYIAADQRRQETSHGTANESSALELGEEDGRDTSESGAGQRRERCESSSQAGGKRGRGGRQVGRPRCERRSKSGHDALKTQCVSTEG